MNSSDGRFKGAVLDRPNDNQRRVEYAMVSIQEMALHAIRAGHSGTIGVEIPVKDGRLGKVKRLQIVFEPE
jgi:hypothetical protein